MNRRTFLQRIAAVPFLGAAVAKAAPGPEILRTRPQQLGILGASYHTPETWNGRGRLYLDGVDVTNVTFEMDFAAGWAGMFTHHHDAEGRLALDVPAVPFWQFGKLDVVCHA